MPAKTPSTHAEHVRLAARRSMNSQRSARRRNLPLLHDFVAKNPCAGCGEANPGKLRVILPPDTYWSRLAVGSTERFTEHLIPGRVRCTKCAPRNVERPKVDVVSTPVRGRPRRLAQA